MAIGVGDYADALRAVGLFIDQAQVPWAEVRSHPEYWEVVWERPACTRIERDALAALRVVGRLYRGLDLDRPRFGACQQLRALGRLFDRTRASGFAVATTPEGLRVSVRVVDQEGSRVYPLEQIEQMAREQRRERIA